MTASALAKEGLPLPMSLSVIVALLACATNLYQTSSSGIPQELAAIFEFVAASTVPAVVVVQVVEEFSKTALLMLSFPGAAYTETWRLILIINNTEARTTLKNMVLKGFGITK